MKLLSHSLVPLLAALVLAGCATAPAIDTATLVATPTTFKEGAAQWTQAAPAEARDRGTWWRAFADPALDALVERASQQNTGIAEAAARLAQARALLRSSESDRALQLGAGAGATRQAGAGTANGSTPSTLLNANLNLSYEVDLFGKLARATDAASLDAQARAALLQSTRLLVQADVAQTYLALRALDAERVLVRETLDAYRNTLQLTQSRFRAGDVAELDVVRVQTEVAATESEALALERRRATLEHALAVLVGDSASSFSLGSVDWSTALPVIPAGVPATVLTRRPDVAAAQSSLLAAQARVGVAQAAWFPSLSLTAAGGFASPELGDVFKWSARAWGVGALLSLPLLDGGRREAGVQAAQAQLDGATAQYRGQVLAAFQEVEDQLSALRLLEQQAQAQGRAVASATRATVLSDSRYRNGLVSQLDLLDARRSELSNRRQALNVRSAQYQSTVTLIRALGGGWETPGKASWEPAPLNLAVQQQAEGLR
ncbi:multidrug efflux system outer membrane protein [Rhodoferax ferrireducens]|uniref:Multidrug efflux system outer membrane protein n=1 Tax=Rhodoferax ferrireducens TaxID=192843 RepID=A0ABU2C573_9BURK|nr:efflux transporter outer membrane subunit [Rhodoferax ferrireducens]MDR7376490.1 multidrug efflux system outer membrane protein [Rhodoferax ferrireducens]